MHKKTGLSKKRFGRASLRRDALGDRRRALICLLSSPITSAEGALYTAVGVQLGMGVWRTHGIHQFDRLLSVFHQLRWSDLERNERCVHRFRLTPSPRITPLRQNMEAADMEVIASHVQCVFAGIQLPKRVGKLDAVDKNWLTHLAVISQQKLVARATLPEKEQGLRVMRFDRGGHVAHEA